MKPNDSVLAHELEVLNEQLKKFQARFLATHPRAQFSLGDGALQIEHFSRDWSAVRSDMEQIAELLDRPGDSWFFKTPKEVLLCTPCVHGNYLRNVFKSVHGEHGLFKINQREGGFLVTRTAA